MDIFLNEITLPIIKNIKMREKKCAFCIDKNYYSYNDLGERIAGVYKSLLDLKEINVGLVVNDDIQTYASILAIWICGKSYVPIHPKQPIERCIEILEQVNTNTILDSSDLSLYNSYNIINTAKLYGDISLIDPITKCDVNSIAYILFTSGSTGKPKGVTISRSNIASFVSSFHRTGINISSDDRCLQCFDLTFDVSIQSFLIPLIAGACVYTVPHEQIKWSYVYGLLEDNNLTFGIMAPSMLRYLQPYFGEMNFPSLRYCILTAEASPLILVSEWAKHIPNAEIYNFYGPTEATIYCTYNKYHLNATNKSLNGLFSIGKPMYGMESIIINEQNDILSDGNKGELCITGPQLTPGYWRNDQKNKEAFFYLLHNNTMKRFYHTGDLCYKDSEGDLMYSGRLDSQAKVQGYRVEIGEIEFHIQEFLNGENIIITTYENEKGNTEIGLAIEGKYRDMKLLENYLRKKIPLYMIPNKTIFIESFPLNSNSKIDRKIIKSMF